VSADGGLGRDPGASYHRRGENPKTKAVLRGKEEKPQKGVGQKENREKKTQKKPKRPQSREGKACENGRKRGFWGDKRPRYKVGDRRGEGIQKKKNTSPW